MPAMSACGPSRRRSSENGPSSELPTTAVVLRRRPPSARRSRPGRAAPGPARRAAGCAGQAASSSAGADVADRGERAGDPVRTRQAATTSARTPSTGSWPSWATRSPSACSHDRAVALLGQQPLVGVQAEREHADARPLAQELHDAGQRAQPAGAVQDDEHVGSSSRPRTGPATRARAVTTAPSSATRRPSVSASVPSRTAVSWPSTGRQCGSQRTQSHVSRAPGSVSTHDLQVARAVQHRGLADHPAAPGRGARRRPASPSTPCSAAAPSPARPARSRRPRGVLRALRVVEHDVRRAGRRCPTRSSRRSGSRRRRSHSRRRGPTAVSSTSAGSGQPARRAARSASSASCASCSIRSLRSRCSCAAGEDCRPCLRSISELPTSVIGLSRPNSR